MSAFQLAVLRLELRDFRVGGVELVAKWIHDLKVSAACQGATLATPFVLRAPRFVSAMKAPIVTAPSTTKMRIENKK